MGGGWESGWFEVGEGSWWFIIMKFGCGWGCGREEGGEKKEEEENEGIVIVKVNQSMVRLGVTIVLLSSAIAIRFDIAYVLSVYISIPITSLISIQRSSKSERHYQTMYVRVESSSRLDYLLVLLIRAVCRKSKSTRPRPCKLGCIDLHAKKGRVSLSVAQVD